KTLIVAFSVFFILLEPAKERVARFAFASAESELWFPAGDADQANKLHLRIFGKSAVEKFVFPIWTAADVKNSIGTLTSIDGNEPLVIDESCFSRGIRARDGRGRFGRKPNLVKIQSGVLGLNLKTKTDLVLLFLGLKFLMSDDGLVA